MTMNVDMQYAGGTNADGLPLFTVRLDDGNAVVPITATAKAFYDLSVELGHLAIDAEKWARAQ